MRMTLQRPAHLNAGWGLQRIYSWKMYVYIICVYIYIFFLHIYIAIVIYIYVQKPAWPGHPLALPFFTRGMLRPQGVVIHVL